MPEYRLGMPQDVFLALPIDPENAISSLWDPVIDANPALMREDFGDVAFLATLPPAMRHFLLLGGFDGQVSNGGITQFFWNSATTIVPVRESLVELGEHELTELYDRAVASLVGNGERWDQLRAKWNSSLPAQDSWDQFRQSYDLLDLGWFEKAYFPTRGDNGAGEWVVLREGLSGPFARRLVEYARSYPADFIIT